MNIHHRNFHLTPILYNLQHRAALEAGGGRVKVPCLLIQHDDGREEWLYESDVINEWIDLLCVDFILTDIKRFY